LPPLEARFGHGLQAVVQAADNPAPLLRVELLANGFVRVGMTPAADENAEQSMARGDAITKWC